MATTSTVTFKKKEMFALLFLSSLFDFGATFMLLGMDVGPIWSYGYLLFFLAVKLLIYAKYGAIRRWLSDVTVDWWSGAGKGLGESVMLPVAVFLSSIGEATGHYLAFQIFFYAQLFLYGIILKPRTDCGLQAFASRLPVITAFRRYGVVWAVCLAVVVVCSTFFRYYLDSTFDLEVEAGLHDVDGGGSEDDDDDE